MAKGERAERHGRCGREYWSRRYSTPLSWGRVGKWLTHRRERARARREEQQALRLPNTDQKDAAA